MSVQNDQPEQCQYGAANTVAQQVAVTLRFRDFYCPLWILLTVSMMLLMPGQTYAQNSRALETYQKQYEDMQADFEGKLKQLAQSCQQDQQLDGVEAVIELLKALQEFDPQSNPLPRAVRAEIPLNLPTAERVWRLKLRSLQEEQANDLFVFSRKFYTPDSPVMPTTGFWKQRFTIPIIDRSG